MAEVTNSPRTIERTSQVAAIQLVSEFLRSLNSQELRIDAAYLYARML